MTYLFSVLPFKGYIKDNGLGIKRDNDTVRSYTHTVRDEMQV